VRSVPDPRGNLLAGQIGRLQKPTGQHHLLLHDVLVRSAARCVTEDAGQVLPRNPQAFGKTGDVNILVQRLTHGIQRTDLLKTYCRDGYRGGFSFYADNWPTWRKNADKTRRQTAPYDDEGYRPVQGIADRLTTSVPCP